jgi:hypothetical protein
MNTGTLDPLIHNPQRLRIVAILAALPEHELSSLLPYRVCAPSSREAFLGNQPSAPRVTLFS